MPVSVGSSSRSAGPASSRSPSRDLSSATAVLDATIVTLIKSHKNRGLRSRVPLYLVPAANRLPPGRVNTDALASGSQASRVSLWVDSGATSSSWESSRSALRYPRVDSFPCAHLRHCDLCHRRHRHRHRRRASDVLASRKAGAPPSQLPACY